MGYEQLWNVYMQLKVRHMFSGKAYTHAVCGHMLCLQAILSLLLENVLVSLTEYSMQN